MVEPTLGGVPAPATVRGELMKILTDRTRSEDEKKTDDYNRAVAQAIMGRNQELDEDKRFSRTEVG